MKRFRACTSLWLLAMTVPGLATAQHYQTTGSIPIGGTGGWDYLNADAESRRLYVSHAGEVVVIDLDSGNRLGTVSGMKRVHGIALADKLNLGFISDGGTNQVLVFDLKTLGVKRKVATGTNPDGIVYDAPSQRVFAFNGRSQDVTVIGAVSGQVEGSIPVGGKPEFPVSDGKGNIYDNIEDKGEIVQIDSKSLKVKAHWPIAPCESPSGLALDKQDSRLFAVCDNKMMAVVDANSGKVVATPAIGEGPDAAGFDPELKMAFSSNGDGTLTVIRQAGKNQYSVVDNVKTAERARTMTIDSKTHKLYLSSAKFSPAPAATADNPHPRPAVLPGPFEVLVVSRQ